MRSEGDGSSGTAGTCAGGGRDLESRGECAVSRRSGLTRGRSRRDAAASGTGRAASQPVSKLAGTAGGARWEGRYPTLGAKTKTRQGWGNPIRPLTGTCVEGGG